jgi:hypothetical protein
MRYLESGHRPIPLWETSAKAKQPRIRWAEYQKRPPSREEVTEWFTQWPTANVGLIMGSGVGVFAVDVDAPEALEELRRHGELPETVTSRTSRGWHYLFEWPDTPIPTKSVSPKVDVRGEGGYIQVWPSSHPTGHVYRWENVANGGFDAPVAKAPQWLLDLILGTPTNSELEQKIPEGWRNSTLTQLAGRMIGQKETPGRVQEELLRMNRERCDPPLPEGEVIAIAGSILERDQKKRRTPTRSVDRAPAKAVAICFSDVKAEATTWLWEGYIPLGNLSIIMGDPGLGKSTMTIDLAARVTTGEPMPDGTPGLTGSVLLLTGEDALPVVAQRLHAAKADTDKAHALSLKEADGIDRMPKFPDDIAQLQAMIEEKDVRLVVIDPLMSFLAGSINSWNDQHVRQALTPLSKVAESTGAAIILVMHPNKREGAKAMYRSGGSLGIVGAARAAFVVAKDPKKPSRCVMASMKSNLSAKPSAFGFHIAVADNKVGRIVWEGKTDLTDDDLMAEAPANQTDRAAGFLRDYLAGGTKDSAEVTAAAKEAGFSDRTIARARGQLGVQSERVGAGKGSHFTMRLPATSGEVGDGKKMLAYKTEKEDRDSLSAFPASSPMVTTALCVGEETVSDEEWQERAAIREYEGGMTRREAEFAAGPRPWITQDEVAA